MLDNGAISTLDAGFYRRTPDFIGALSAE